MRNVRSQFLSLFTFLVLAFLILTNGGIQRIFAEPKSADVFEATDPLANALKEILENYVNDPDIDKVVEGALSGMMGALDKHSSYISPDVLKNVEEDTEGQFEGVGISIRNSEDGKTIIVVEPIKDSPAFKAGVKKGDILLEIEGKSALGMTTAEAAKLIKGPRGTEVRIKVTRARSDGSGETETIEFVLKRSNVPIPSLNEVRMLDGGIAYMWLHDFKKSSAKDIAEHIDKFSKEGMRAFILDLRWNPGGLLTASKEVCELFLPKNTLVTYTKGRTNGDGSTHDEMRLFTERTPVLNEEMPMVILVNEYSASASEIVTGALQYYKRAIVIGQKTYGKGSVQTILPLQRPEGAALRLTTALYYTPANVTINDRGIKPDVESTMSKKDQRGLIRQLGKSYEDDVDKKNSQNHGSVSGNEINADTVEDTPLKRATEILKEDTVWANLIGKYHRDTMETQVAALTDEEKAADAAREEEARRLLAEPESQLKSPDQP
jgi:carboxyl-terminal processing protease